MAAITIGPGATDRASETASHGWTLLSLDSPANNTGAITYFEIWFSAAIESNDATSVKIGTFSGSGTSWTNRDGESLGNVAAGSKQTFSGKNCDVVTGDVLGIYYYLGCLERTDSGGSAAFCDGDQFGTGTQTYGTGTRIYSIYGIGATSVVAPTVTTQAASSVEATTATGNGNITATGGENASAWGICVCLAVHSESPDTGDTVFAGSGGGGTGAFTALVTSLSTGTDYHFRAYATNSAGTSYGATVDVLTKPAPFRSYYLHILAH